MKLGHYSKHAALRMAQRGLGSTDIELIMTYGHEVQDGYMILEMDYKSVERECKALIEKIRRLKGKRLVHINGCLVTIFHASHSEEHRILKETNKRTMELAA